MRSSKQITHRCAIAIYGSQWRINSSHLLVQKVFTTLSCDEKESLHLSYAYACVMWVMSENFSEKVFWCCRIKFCNEQKIFFKEKIFLLNRNFLRKSFCSRRKNFCGVEKFSCCRKLFFTLVSPNFSCTTKNFCCGKWIEFTIADIVKRLQQLANEAGAQRRMRKRQKAPSLDTCGPNSESWGRQFVKDAALVHECDRIDRSSELFWKSSSANRGAAHFFSKGLAKNVRFAFREFMNS